MIDPQTQSILQEIVRRESRSLLCYVGDAYPWATLAETESAATLNRLIREERAAVTALGRFLVRHKVSPPPLASYPSSFTSFNFVALDFLLVRLREVQQHLIAELKTNLGWIVDPDARAAVEKLLAVKEKTWAFLEQYTQRSPRAGRA